MAVAIAPSTVDLATTGIPYMHGIGDMRMVVAKVTLDTSYPTGGYIITPQQLGMLSGRPYFADTDIVFPGPVASAITAAWYDVATNALKLFTVGAELANTTTAAGMIVQIHLYGA